MVVGEVATGTDVLVIGGGPGGYTAALQAAARGRSVTLVERDRLGGVCLNTGCIPSKALLHAADLAAAPAEAAATGIRLSAEVDMPAVQAWMAGVVGRLTGDVASLLAAAGVTVVSGTARFATPRRVAVWKGDDAHFFEFGAAIVATGSRPVEPAALTVDGHRVLDSTGALALDHVPARLVVVGGGYIGVELGTAFAKLGGRVTIVEATAGLLPELPRSLARVVERSLVARGADLRLETAAVGLDGSGASPAGLVVESPAGEATIPADTVIVATGRRPNTDGLGLETAGVPVGADGLVAVDAARRTRRPAIFAIGDVTAGPALAHKATAEAGVAAVTATGGRAAFDPAAVPMVVYSDPEVASVGATVEQARAGGADVRSFSFPLACSGRARTIGRLEGEVQVVADGDGTVLGVHLAGRGVSELAYGAALAVEMGATVEDLALTVAPHPTLSEALAEAAMGAAARPLHVRPPLQPPA